MRSNTRHLTREFPFEIRVNRTSVSSGLERFEPISASVFSLALTVLGWGLLNDALKPA